jgi:hypothetical protein
MAQAAGETAPTAVSAAATANMIQGIAAIRPPTARTAWCTSQSIVPFFWAMANR